MTQQDESAAYRAAMCDQTLSAWLRYWLMIAWEIRPQRAALDDARRLCEALVTPTPNLRVSAILVDASASYWLRQALSTALKSHAATAPHEAELLVDVLVDRFNSRGGK